MRKAALVALMLLVSVAASGQGRKRVPDGTIILWVERLFGGDPNLLQTELSINGKTVNIYTTETWEPVEQYLQKGWNTVTLDTTLQEPGDVNNGLLFRVGPVVNDRSRAGAFTMAPVLWEFRNYSDWRKLNGRFRHDSGPNVRNVKLSYRFYWAGLQDEVRELAAGDYVLASRPNYGNADPPMTATVSVNGHVLNSFIAPRRQVVITPYLKKGKNEIKVTSSRIDQIIGKNDVEFFILGPARWSASQGQFVLTPVTEFTAMQGWKRDDDSGRLISSSNPKADAVERVIPFMVKDSEEPAGN